MVNFCNPGVLGTPKNFHRHYEAPILAGREPGASPEQRGRGAERSAELSAIVNEFILRRTNSLLSKHLPPKVSSRPCAQAVRGFIQALRLRCTWGSGFTR